MARDRVRLLFWPTTNGHSAEPRQQPKRVLIFFVVNTIQPVRFDWEQGIRSALQAKPMGHWILTWSLPIFSASRIRSMWKNSSVCFDTSIQVVESTW